MGFQTDFQLLPYGACLEQLPKDLIRRSQNCVAYTGAGEKPWVEGVAILGAVEKSARFR